MKAKSFKFDAALLMSHMQAKERRKEALAWRKIKPRKFQQVRA